MERSRRDTAEDARLDAQPYVHVRSLSKSYFSRSSVVTALEDISFDVKESELVAVVGPSGCGKTTLLRIIAGLLPKDKGEIAVEGVSVSRSSRPKVGMVFQTPALLAWRSVVDNIMLPIDFMRAHREDYISTAHELIRLTSLQGFEDKYPFQLSGGMQQRAAICRALIHDPLLLLMDEPFGALDAFTREQMGLELLRIWGQKRKTIILVTHDVGESVFLADRVIVLTARPATVAATLEIRLPRPRDVLVKSSSEYGNYTAIIREKLGLLGKA